MSNLILASSNEKRLAFWMQGLSGFSNATLVKDDLAIGKLDALRLEVMRMNPQVLLLDYDLLGFESSYSFGSLRKLCAETKIIILSGEISEETEWELLRAGIRGCCQRDVAPELLKQIVMAVKEGELWIRRALVGRLVDELAKAASIKNNAYRGPLGLLNKLTQREYDIAVRVGFGDSNKQIAQACGITERTVKAHLTGIFNKLGVVDRLNLALVLASDNRVSYADIDSTFNGGSRVNDIKSLALHTFP